MVLESVQGILYLFTSFSAMMAVFFAFKVLISLFKKKSKNPGKKAITLIFSLFAIGVFFIASAEIIWSILFISTGITPAVGLTDILWVIGYIFLIAGFFYFMVYICLLNKQCFGDLLFTLIVTAIVTYFISFLLQQYVISFQNGESIFEIFLAYFYPLSSVIMLIFSFSVYNQFKRIDELGIPLIYLAFAILVQFVADLIFVYSSLNGIYGALGILSDILYIMEYLIIAFAFYLLYAQLNKKKGANA